MDLTGFSANNDGVEIKGGADRILKLFVLEDVDAFPIPTPPYASIEASVTIATDITFKLTKSAHEFVMDANMVGFEMPKDGEIGNSNHTFTLTMKKKGLHKGLYGFLKLFSASNLGMEFTDAGTRYIVGTPENPLMIGDGSGLFGGSSRSENKETVVTLVAPGNALFFYEGTTLPTV